MQNFELESLPMGADHSQMVKAAHVGSDSSSKVCVNLTSSTAVSRFKAGYAEIPWKQMAGIRDILIHEYFDIDLDLTWQVVKRELQPLKAKLEVLLSQGPEVTR